MCRRDNMKIVIDSYKKNKIRKCYFCEREDYDYTREIDCYIATAFRLKIDNNKEVCICNNCLKRLTLSMLIEGNDILKEGVKLNES